MLEAQVINAQHTQTDAYLGTDGIQFRVKGLFRHVELGDPHRNDARLAPDADAQYASELELDLATVIPNVSGPNDVKTMTSLPDIEQKKVKINKAWLMD